MNLRNRVSRTTAFFLSLPLLVALAVCSGCSTAGYYAQAVGGHLKLMSQRQPLDEVMASAETDDEIRRKLQLLRDARVYAVDELALPENESYSTFVETGKRYVTWNVVATPEFSMSPKTWCFPIAGCVSYRGYYAESDAQAYEAGLKSQGFDTQIGGATAYSTLGWFDDPLLDTMLRGSDIRLVGVLFHELAHQLLYVKNDSSFNEAFATFVEQEGARSWLRDIGKADSIPIYQAYLQRQIDFNALLQQTRAELVELFEDFTEAAETGDAITDADKRLRKQAVFDQLNQRYEAIKTDKWEGFKGYDNWFSRELNNARLISVSTYLKWVSAFAVLYEEADNDIEGFYQASKALADKPYDERQVALQDLLARAVASE